MFGRKQTTAPTASPVAVDVTDSAVAVASTPAETPLWTPPVAVRRRSVESVLFERGIVNESQLEQARASYGQSQARSVPQILLSMNAATEPAIASALAESMSLPYVSPQRIDIDEAMFALLGGDYCRARHVLPMRGIEPGRVTLAVCDPNDVFLIDDVRQRMRCDVRIVVTAQSEISRVLEQIAGSKSDAGATVDAIMKDMAEDDVELVQQAQPKQEEADDLERAGNESPVIRFVNYLIADALRQGASDIHIEPKEGVLKIRYRIDGILFEAMSPPPGMHAAITSRLKIMANLDISERRLPQDGRIRANVANRKIDLRLSTLPTANGEKSVMRILDNRSISVPLEALGFSQQALTIWKNQIEQPHGILLVTGPTGSGKTTTLYSSLRVMDGNELNISTVEDPIEYQPHAAEPGSGARQDRHDLLGGTAVAAAAGSGRDHARRDPRRRDRPHRGAGRADRPHGPEHAAHERRAELRSRD